jgi:hypothetical protein
MESIRFTRQEEAELCRRMRQGDGEAKELLAKSVLSWAVDMAHRLENGQASLSPDVVESAAYMAVARALKTFDPDKGRLTTHVSFYVRASIMDERRIRHVIHIPAYLLESNEKETPLREQLWVQAETALAIYPIDRMLHPRRSWKRGLSKAHDRWDGPRPASRAKMRMSAGTSSSAVRSPCQSLGNGFLGMCKSWSCGTRGWSSIKLVSSLGSAASGPGSWKPGLCGSSASGQRS